MTPVPCTREQKCPGTKHSVAAQGTVGGSATSVLTKLWWLKAPCTVFYLWPIYWCGPWGPPGMPAILWWIDPEITLLTSPFDWRSIWGEYRSTRSIDSTFDHSHDSAHTVPRRSTRSTWPLNTTDISLWFFICNPQVNVFVLKLCCCCFLLASAVCFVISLSSYLCHEVL